MKFRGFLKNSNYWKQYWANRKIDWQQSYCDPTNPNDTIGHPHRKMIIDCLKKFSFGSILELGCASGANLYLISKIFPTVQVGGVDISKDAIETARRLLPPRSILQVDSVDEMFFSDKSTDVILTDACLIYIDPIKIHKVMKEIKRIARKNIVLVEFHSPHWWERLGIWWGSGYFAYDYKKLLTKYGFNDIEMVKIPEQTWGYPWSKWGYLIYAKG